MSAFDPKRTFGNQAFCTAMGHFREAGLTRYDARPGARQGNEAALKSRREDRRGRTPQKRATRQNAVLRRHTGATNLADTARLARERDEALEREKASAEILRIISRSPGELKPIFQAMLENAVRICEAVFG